MARFDSGYLPRENPCAQCGKPIAKPDWIESVQAAPPISGIAAPATIASRRSRSTKTHPDSRRPDLFTTLRFRREPYRFARNAMFANVLASAAERCSAEPAIESARSAHAAAGRAATARRHARARWRWRSKGRGRSRWPRPCCARRRRARTAPAYSLLRIRNAGAVVLDVDGEPGPPIREADRRFGAEPHRIFDQIGDAAMQIVRPHRGHRMVRGRHRRPCGPCRRTGR